MYIRDEEGLREFCDQIRGAKVVGVDTEFLRERTYYPRLCLIQVATDEQSAAIDPILIHDLGSLRRILTDDGVTKVFHACSQDMEVIHDAMGCFPAPVFDTQVAAAFLGQRQQLGYGALVEAYTGVHLPKAESLTDWSRRPLDPEQLRYAEDDARYLPGIYARMMDELVRKGRLGWVLPEMEELCDARHFERRPEDAYLHLKRSGSLTRRQLAVAREVCAWRERLAASHDVPRKWILSDEVIVECCKRVPRTTERLLRIRGTEQLSREDARAVVEAVGRGVSCDPADYPASMHHTRPSAETESVVDLMNAMLRLLADRAGIAPQLIATRDDLVEFASGSPSSRLASSWRYELVGQHLARLLDGEVGLTVKDGRIEML